MEKLGQEPAFACQPIRENGQYMDMGSTGMSKRLYLAGMAMQGILAGGYFNLHSQSHEICERSFSIADELLKQENL